MIQFLVWESKFEPPAEIRVTKKEGIQNQKIEMLCKKDPDKAWHRKENFPKRSSEM